MYSFVVTQIVLSLCDSYVDTTQIPEEYFDWPLYHPLKFDVSWNEKPEAIIQGYISGATSIWSEALQVYPQEQPLRIETPACFVRGSRYSAIHLLDTKYRQVPQ